MRLRLLRAREYATSHLWVMPAAFLLAAAVLAEAMLTIDKLTDLPSSRWYLFPGGAAAARQLLSTIAASMFTFTGLVFSITIVVLQLASSQLSPRVMRVFLRDIGTQIVLGSFLGAFAYSLLVLREVEAAPEANVPSLSIWIALMITIVDIGLFVYYINHITQRIRPITIMHEIGGATLKTIHSVYPTAYSPDSIGYSVEPPGDHLSVRHEGRGGVIVYVDKGALHQIARDNGLVIAVVPAVGDYIPRGSELLRVWGDVEDPGALRLQRHVEVGRERTQQQDVGFGFRELVDIAERALSPGVNDPTTAVQALNEIHDLLSDLAGRAIPADADLTDALLITREPVWEDFVHHALDEIRTSGRGSLQVMRRLRFLLEDLLRAAPEARRPVLQHQLALLDSTLAAGFSRLGEREIAAASSAQGFGPVSIQTAPRRR